MEPFDLIVIGAGPAGLSSAVEAHRGGLERVRILEKGDSHSQMIRTYYKEGKRVDARYAGQEAICFGMLCLRDGNRESYLSLMDHVIESYKLEIDYKTEVWAITRNESAKLFEVKTSKEALFAKAVIVAIGKMGRPNQPDYYRQIPPTLKNSGRILFDITSRTLGGLNLLVVGGGDSAAEYCDILARSNTVTLSYRRKEFTKMNPMNLKILQGLLAEGHATARLGSNITGIDDEGGNCRVKFDDGSSEVYDAVVYALGGMNPVEFMRASGVELNDRGEPIVSTDHESSVPGLYIVGDLLGKGKGGGSIIAGFNSASEAVRHLLFAQWNKKLEPEFVALDHMKF